MGHPCGVLLHGEHKAMNFDTEIGMCVQCKFGGVWLFYLEWDISLWAFYCDNGFGVLVPCTPVDAVLAD